MALSPSGKEADFPDSLSVLSTHHDVNVGHVRATGDTSAATAAAARLGALVCTEYPTLWPETVRALIVDSAEWTPRMKAEIAATKKNEHAARLVRCFGFGVPSLERALWSASNALTLVIQDEVQPFTGEKSNEMHLHRLPWPRDALESLGGIQVELRVTLSYFIEPNPARRGWQKRLALGRSESKACYALIVSIRSPSTTVDIYELVATLVRTPIETVVRA